MQSTVVSVIFLTAAFARISEIQLPSNMTECFLRAKTEENLTKTVVEVVYSRCVQRILFSHPKVDQTKDLADDAVKWISGLIDSTSAIFDIQGNTTNLAGDSHSIRQRRQAARGQPRLRKEYRMLSDAERNQFHRAMNMLKADRSVSPNKFDALGRLHYISVGRAHSGPNFLPWHRMFLVVVENALREKIPSVTIPYWDSTLDDALRDPRSSIIWTPEFLGQANGYIIDGPFADWSTPTGALIRYFGAAGTLFNWTFIHNVFRQSHLENITFPYAKPENNIEEHHSEIHRWIGGHMSPPALAAFDPVFYLLHSYVDLLWEIFRGLQKRRGIDVNTDYPMNNTEIPAGQRFDDPSGFGSLLNRHGLSNVFTDEIYKYDRPPSCTREQPDCGSPHIRCDLSGKEPKCISTSIFDLRQLLTADGLPMKGGSGIRETRSTHVHNVKNANQYLELGQHVSDIKCKPNNVNEKYTNQFDIDGVVNKSSWRYVPIQVINKNLPNYSERGKFAKYNICGKNNSSPSSQRIFVESNGINYLGSFKEISHFSNDLKTSGIISFVGVRQPTVDKPSEALIAAYDACGRMCQPYCLDIAGSKYHKCPGVIKITNELPLMFGSDVTSAANELWRDDISGLPYVVENQIFLKLVCDINDSFWPW